MAELFVGPIIDNIINTCLDYLKDQLFGQTSMKEVLERLQKRLPIIRSVVSSYNQTQIRGQDPALDRWIWQLRDAIDEADDLLDEFDYMKHKEQISKNMEETKNKNVFPNTNFLFESAHEFLKVGERALKIDPNMKRLEEVVQNLDKVSAEVSTFLYLLESTKQKQQEQQLELYKTRETGSLPSNDLIGRGKDKEFVMQWLRKESHSNQKQKTHITSTLYKNISLLSIVGHGGMGKTTLLQHVYEDEITKEFDLKMWVCVSNNFDVKKVISDMLESLRKNRPHLESLHALQESLKSEVMSKKFLLVLDDIWEEEEERDKRKWESVLASMAYGCLGSKILVTTRMDSVASMIAKVIKNKKETLSLEGLEEDECLQLLNNHAFADVENPDDHKKLKFISGEIVKKLSGSPLAAKVIGGVLSSNFDEKYWRKVLTVDFGNAQFIQNDIFSIIRLSYTILPIPLQICFAFCSIFPQDFQFDKEDLVRMWIALGFIQTPSTSRESLEDIGGKYFDTLVKKSFFDMFENKSRTWYKMHDLLHELTQFISAQECFRVVDDEELLFKIPDTIRHLSVEIKNLDVLRKLRKFKNLRSLFLSYKNYYQSPIDVPTEVFEALRSIRLLHITNSSIKMTPEAITHLIHLRYLKIHRTSVTQLPRSISHLYHLQFIICEVISNYIPNGFLPRDINNLSNLHHLKLPMHQFRTICGIGKLKYLQELEEFYVRNEIGYRIEELKHMNDLRRLKIECLENVKDAEEACSAKFCDKKNLTNLSLQWGHRESVVPDLDEKLLDNIQPHNNLKNLIINGYMGVRPAIWMNNAHLIHNLEYIDLFGCQEWQNLPPFGQLPFLKSLSLSGMPKVKRLDNKFHGNDKYCVFPSLKVLCIYSLEALEDWFDARVTSTDNCLFPCLTELYLICCPNLKELPYFPPKLKTLEIDNIGWKTLNFYSISKFISLNTLKVLQCPDITYIRLADEIARLAALKKLTIKGCPSLISLGEHQEAKTTENSLLFLNELFISDPIMLQMEALRSITSLQEVTIGENDELVSFSIETEQWFLQVRSSLRKMNFRSLKSLQSLPSSLEILSTLNFLHVSNIPQLQRLPNIPMSLETLNLYYLESLQCLPSSLSTISSLKFLKLYQIPLLESLPDLPPSLYSLHLEYLDNLNCLPSSLSSLSSLSTLCIDSLPQLKELPDLPPSLQALHLIHLCNLNSLPCCLSSLSSLIIFSIRSVPRLRELPDLPSTLTSLYIRDCHPEFMERYEKISGSDWHKIARIPFVSISKR